MPPIFGDDESRRESIRGRMLDMDARYAGRRMPEQQRREWDRMSAELRELGDRTVRRGQAARGESLPEPLPPVVPSPPAGEWGSLALGGDIFTYSHPMVTLTTATNTTAPPDVAVPLTYQVTYSQAATIRISNIMPRVAQTAEQLLMACEIRRRQALPRDHATAHDLGNAWMERPNRLQDPTYRERELARMRRELQTRERARLTGYTVPTFIEGPGWSPLGSSIIDRAAIARQAGISQTRVRARQMRARVAQRRAAQLLLENLTEQQAKEWKTHKHFHIESVDGRRTYRIVYGIQGNVHVVQDKDCPPGTPRRTDGALRGYCCHLADPDECPVEDNLLAQKLWIQTREKEFLALANPM